MSERTIEELKSLQALPLDIKILMTKRRIRDWINEFTESGVYVSFSGGKDSTVLLDLVRQDFPEVKAVFVDTGLEYPEIREFVKTFDNVDWLKPQMNFKEVIEKYGYPFISKEVAESVFYAKKALTGEETKEGLRRLEKLMGTGIYKKSMFNQEKWAFMTNAPFTVGKGCCQIMKKKPIHKYNKETNRKPITGQTAEESVLRRSQWLVHGCNSFDGKNPISNPLSFWTEQDILKYIYIYNLPIASVYGQVVIDYESEEQCNGQFSIDEYEWKYKTTGVKRTGCMFCGFGCHLEKDGEGRFEMMKKTHPRQYEYIMKPVENGGLNYKFIIDWLNENGKLNIRY